MNKTNDKKPGTRPGRGHAALGGYRMSKRDKYAWTGLLAAIIILSLAWWAHSSD